MPSPTQDPWLTGRTWRIVRADLNLAHVFIPLSSFTFEAAVTPEGVSGYTIAHTYQAPLPDFFTGIFLRPVGNSQADFQAITQKISLPLYSKTSATEYADVSDQIAIYMEKNPGFQHLESEIMVPCHADSAAVPGNAAPSHPRKWAPTSIHIYQFSNVVNEDLPLLVIRAPLSPLCPANGGGTATGYS
jgi:hypothetical protein